MDLIILFFAGLLGGAINSLAGGGSFITFPALVFVGVPPIIANATNTFAACPGYLSGALAFKKELLSIKKDLPKLIGLSLLGGLIGAWILTKTSADGFERAVPWLLLFATLLFIFGGRLNELLKDFGSKNSKILKPIALALSGLFFLICLYGGFFNAGLGIILLSFTALAGYENINVMNGIKLIASTTVSIVAVFLFAFEGLIAWYFGAVVLAGGMVGAYGAAVLSKKLPQQWVRSAVIVISIVTTLYFFYVTYF